MLPENIRTIDRPDPALLTLYLLRAGLPYAGLLGVACITYGATLPIIALTFLPMYVRYHTLRYRFDESGVAVSWGYFFRSETYLTYEKIQDIHLSRGLFERWLGIGTVAIQTAAGSSEAEECLVGLRAFEPVRDYLYSRMRTGLRAPTPLAAPHAPAGVLGFAAPGDSGPGSAAPTGTPAPASVPTPAAQEQLVELLGEIHAEVVALRRAVERLGEGGVP